MTEQKIGAYACDMKEALPTTTSGHVSKATVCIQKTNKIFRNVISINKFVSETMEISKKYKLPVFISLNLT